MAILKTELRIGNKVTIAHASNAPIVTIKELRDSEVLFQEEMEYGWYSYEILLPIKITSEWLELFGFYSFNYKEGLKWRLDYGADINFSLEDNILIPDRYYTGQSMCQGAFPDSVHKLQNLIYSLTAKELIITP